MNKLSNIFKQPDGGPVEKSKPAIGLKIAFDRLTRRGRIKGYLYNKDIVGLLRKAYLEGAFGNSNFDDWLEMMIKIHK